MVMRSLMLAAAAVAGAVALAAPAEARLITQELKAGESTIYEHRLVAHDKAYSIAYTCTVPTGAAGVVTLAKQTGGPSRHDLEVADRIVRDGPLHIRSTGIVAQQNGGAPYPSVVIIPPDFSGPISWPIVVHARDEQPARYRVYCDSVNLFEQAAWAAAETALVAFLSGSGLDAGDNVGQAANLGLSLIMRDNLLAVGLDAAREEMLIELARQFPNDKLTMRFFGAFLANVLQATYKSAVYEMSPTAVRY